MRSLHATSHVTGESQASPEPSPCIWSIAGGKGGVGKTALASNLGVALARRGKRCVLVDLDLGGANLHTVLGVPTPTRTLSHFLKREVEELSDICQPTSTPNLTLISGAQSFLDIANLKHAQKERLIRHISTLDADHVILDVSAGSAYNALDFFLVGQHRILTVVPEVLALSDRLVLWAAATPAIAVWCYLFDGVYVGAMRSADMRNGMVISFLVYLAALHWLPQAFGNDGLWAALMVFFALRGLTLAVRYPALERSLNNIGVKA